MKEEAALGSALVPLWCQEPISQALSRFATCRSTANIQRQLAAPSLQSQEGTSPSFIPPNISVPGPCDPEDLLDGVIFGAKYLGSTQLVSERNPPTSVRMAQAQEAVDRIKVCGGTAWPLVGAGQCSGRGCAQGEPRLWGRDLIGALCRHRRGSPNP